MRSTGADAGTHSSLQISVFDSCVMHLQSSGHQHSVPH